MCTLVSIRLPSDHLSTRTHFPLYSTNTLKCFFCARNQSAYSAKNWEYHDKRDTVLIKLLVPSWKMMLLPHNFQVTPNKATSSPSPLKNRPQTPFFHSQSPRVPVDPWADPHTSCSWAGPFLTSQSTSWHFLAMVVTVSAPFSSKVTFCRTECWKFKECKAKLHFTIKKIMWITS